MFKFPKKDNEYQMGMVICELLKVYDRVEVIDRGDYVLIGCGTASEDE